MDAEKIAKSGQEQAVAAWIGYLNQLRIDELLESLHAQDINLESAIKELNRAIKSVHVDVIGKNLGGDKGMHGWIAEVADVGIANARRLIVGEEKNMWWEGYKDGPIDIVRGGSEFIQTKFYSSWGRRSLEAAAKHLEKYPSFLAQNGKYQIPKDQYENIERLLNMSQREAGRLVKSEGGISYSDWEYVQKFFGADGFSIDNFEPSILDYKEVQRGSIDTTMAGQKSSLLKTDQSIRDEAYEKSSPSLDEGIKATAVAAVIEGGTALVMKIVEKRRSGKRFSDFNAQDWAEIGGATGKGIGAGGIRGASIYILTNFTATSAAVANALVTSSFGIAEQAHRMRAREIDEVEFIENAELLSLDASVSALSSFLGQAIIPVPVLGAVIGNTVGMVMYQAAKDCLSEKEQELIQAYAEEQRKLDAELTGEYARCIELLRDGLSNYFDLLSRAFDPNPTLAFEGSIVLARELGVPTEMILDTREKAASFFMD